jgi:hypothetical protein
MYVFRLSLCKLSLSLEFSRVGEDFRSLGTFNNCGGNEKGCIRDEMHPFYRRFCRVRLFCSLNLECHD